MGRFSVTEDFDAKVIRELQEMRMADRVQAFRDAGWVPLAFHEVAVQAAYQAGREAEMEQVQDDLRHWAMELRHKGQLQMAAETVGAVMDRLADKFMHGKG